MESKTIIIQSPDDVVIRDAPVSVVREEESTTIITRCEQGLRGASGLSAYQLAVLGGFVGSETEWLESLKAAVGGISTDSGNALVEGTDKGLFVPDLVADPVAYYILAKA